MKRFAAALVFVMLTACVAYAGQEGQTPPPHPTERHMHPGGPGIIKMAEELNLSAEQKRAVATILKENREAKKQLREVMKQAMEGMHSVMENTPGDEAAVRKAAQAVAKAGEELAVNAGKIKARIDGVLTPEQKNKLAQKKAEFKDKFRAKFKDRQEKRQKDVDEWIDKALKP